MKGSDFLKSKWMEEAIKPDAENRVKSQFDLWSKRVSHTGITRRARDLWDYVLSGKISGTDKVIVIAALLYIISPLDLIPDVIPVVGWMDDIGVAAFVLSFISGKLDSHAIEEEIGGTTLNKSKFYGALDPFKDTGMGYKGLMHKISELKSHALTMEALDMVSQAEYIESSMEDPFYKVMFVGRINTGKSTVINAFLGKEYVLVKPTPTRRPVTYIMAGEEELLCSESKNGEITIYESITDLLDEHNQDIENANKISLFLPGLRCTENICFIDSPGLADPNQDFSNLTLREVALVDALILVLDDYLIGDVEMAFLQELLSADRNRKVFVVINKTDGKTKAEIKKMKTNVEENLREYKIPVNRIYLLSAKDACNAALQNQTLPDDFEAFKESLLTYLRLNNKSARESIIRKRIEECNESISDLCKGYIELGGKGVKEQALITAGLNKNKKEIENRISREDTILRNELESYERIFMSDFKGFCSALKNEIAIRVEKIVDLDHIRSIDNLSAYIKESIVSFVDKDLQHVNQKLNKYIVKQIDSIQSELQKMDFPVPFRRTPSYLEGHPGPITVGILIIAWPLVSILTFLSLIVGAVLGRRLIEETIIGPILKKYALNKAKSEIVRQVNQQIDKLRSDEEFEKVIHDHFEYLYREAKAGMRTSLLGTFAVPLGLAEADLTKNAAMAAQAQRILNTLHAS